ncbi:hypothetical protein KIPB_013576 [Kipferlia bialata]|uniref:EF-hand domain-containing protein n=1 Tax=Kipferlia bialata TaxID=797122 RepID=A0A9K3GQ90_9EUKA|nr:hypothetical protein KIPB_013576 [Kipferlia bialata]|eukprot:g13576.t1
MPPHTPPPPPPPNPQFDTHRTGEISFDEFKALDAFVSNVRSNFLANDKDGNGFIDRNELWAAVSGARLHMSQQCFQV